MNKLYRCDSCGIPEGGTHDVACPKADDPSREVYEQHIVHCCNCGAIDPEMHNSRETPLGSIQRFPGYLCVDCWIRFNPSWQGKFTKPKPRANPAWIVWALFAIVLAVGVILHLAIDPR
jgi:hypothetical protein